MADSRLERPLWRGRTNVDAYTIACIEHAEQIVRDEAPKIAHPFDVTQGGYQGTAGDPDSGTTHRLGGGTDIDYCGHAVCYSALRRAGMFIWHRDPSQGDWNDHFHGAPIGHPFMDARLAAQETSYFAGGDGLGGRDTGPRFTPIPRPIWPYPEDDMAQHSEQLDTIEQKVDRVIDKLEGARKRQVATTALLRKLRKGITDVATLAEIDALLDEG